MKLLGVKNKTHFVASIGHHDYIKYADLMADGGQVGCHDYAGYSRFSGERCYAEVPKTFGELFTDYQQNPAREREYGIWNLKDIKILTKKEYPDVECFAWKIENAVWGTRGKDGKNPLKYIHLIYAETDHLQAILNTQNKIQTETRDIILTILAERGVCEA